MSWFCNHFAAELSCCATKLQICQQVSNLECPLNALRKKSDELFKSACMHAYLGLCCRCRCTPPHWPSVCRLSRSSLAQLDLPVKIWRAAIQSAALPVPIPTSAWPMQLEEAALEHCLPSDTVHGQCSTVFYCGTEPAACLFYKAEVISVDV